MGQVRVVADPFNVSVKVSVLGLAPGAVLTLTLNFPIVPDVDTTLSCCVTEALLPQRPPHITGEY